MHRQTVIFSALILLILTTPGTGISAQDNVPYRSSKSNYFKDTKDSAYFNQKNNYHGKSKDSGYFNKKSAYWNRKSAYFKTEDQSLTDKLFSNIKQFFAK